MDFVLHTNKRRLAIVGTGHRGAGTWAWDAPAAAEEEVELVGLSDANPARLAVVADNLGLSGPTVSPDLDAMLDAARPHTLIVCTRDDTHADIIVHALERGIDVVTEKPMATTAEGCRRILDAEARTGRRVDVAFNYRFAPTSRKIRELLAAGRIGEVSSVDFHWYLDTEHGADYFRRWHAYKRHSGGLFVHKATHHFDLLNWWIGADPVRVFAQGSLRRYGAAGPFRGVRCKGCAHAGECEFFFDLADNSWLSRSTRPLRGRRLRARRLRLPRGHRHLRHDDRRHPLRERRAGGYSLNTFMPIEGYHLAFNGTKGRIEVRMYEKQAFEAPHGEDEILVLGTDRSVERIRVEHGPGGHFGGDPLLHRSLFVPRPAIPTASGPGRGRAPCRC